MGGVDGTRLTRDEENLDPFIDQLIQGRYRVISKLAAGSTGTVYLTQINTGSQVAVKVLRPEYATDKTFVEEFRQHMQAVAALSGHHSNITRIFECAQAEDGRLFIAMEYLDGRLLSDILRQEGALNIERALLLAEQMAEGLSAAHAAGIVHTDIRPSNFMIVGRVGAIKILGFEGARLGGVGLTDSAARPGAVPRALEYLAPEQVEGKEITKQTDIYALGVVLYQMLTGLVPFRTPMSNAALAMQLREGPIPLKQLCPRIPTELEAKVLQALEKEPNKRESYANDIVNRSLRELVTEELRGEPGQKAAGVISPGRRALQAALGRPRRMSVKAEHGKADGTLARIQPTVGGAGRRTTKPRRVGPRLMLAAMIGLLILVAIPLVWTFFGHRTPQAPFAPSVQVTEPSSPKIMKAAEAPETGSVSQPDPEAAAGPVTAMTSEPEGRAQEVAPLLPQQRAAPDARPKTSTSQGTRNPAEKKAPAAPRQRGVKPPQVSRVLPTPRKEEPDIKTPATQKESPSPAPDPTEVIDWLLQHR